MSLLKAEGAARERLACSLPMDRIVPNPDQPRKGFDDYALLSLASSIRQHGLLQPITVRPRDNGYEIVLGERRYRACRLLGLDRIDAFILPADEKESVMLALIENLQRENLHYLEEAQACARLLSGGLSPEGLARKLGKSASWVEEKVRLLQLEEEVRDCLSREELGEGHARALLALENKESRLHFARLAFQQHWTVRELERQVRKTGKTASDLAGGRKVISLVRDHRLYANAIKNVAEQLRAAGGKVRVETEEGEGWIELRIRMGKRP